MVLDVVRLPDARLKTPCAAVDPADPTLAPFVQHMLETMRHHPRCVGLAANQVGKNWQVITVDASRLDKPGTRHGEFVMLNPRSIRKEGQIMLREGCLSVPEYTGNVLRATLVEVEGLDRHGKPFTILAEGFEAIVLQHELDHLEGKLFLDRVASVETDVFRRKKFG